MKRLLLSFFFLFSLLSLKAQQSVSIGTTETNNNAVLWLNGNGSQGLLLPIVPDRANFAPIAAGAGMLIFEMASMKVYYSNGNSWVEVGGGGTGGAGGITISGNQISLTGTSQNMQLAATNPTDTQPGQILMWNGTAWTSSAVTIPQAGQVLKWNGTSWVAQTDDTGVGTTPTLNNGQILIGDGTNNIPFSLSGDATLNGATLTIINNAITSEKIDDGTITSTDIADATITNTDIAEATINSGKLAPSAATEGQVLKFVGGAWTPSGDDTGTGTLPSLAANQLVTNNGTSNIAISVSGDIAFDANNAGNTMTIVNDAITTEKIADGTITGADLESSINFSTTGTLSATGTTVTLSPSGSLTLKDSSWPSSNGTGVLTNDGTGALTWTPSSSTSTLNSANIFVGNSSNVATGVPLTGDATISNTGALTINNGAISGGTAGKIADGTITGADLATNIAITTSGAFSSTGNFSATGTTVNIKGATWPAANASGALVNNGSGVLSWTPTMTGTLNSANIFVGNASNVATGVPLSGDATISNSGALTINAGAISGGSAGKIADGTITAADLATNIAITTSGAISTTGNFSATGTTLNLKGATWPASNATGALVNNGTGTLSWTPTLTGTLNSANIFVGNGSNVATGVAMSGDATISNAGALTISAGAISGGAAGKIADGTITGADLATDIAVSTSGAISTTGNFSATGTTVNLKGATWPAANATGSLTNNGSGTLSWTPTLTGTLNSANIFVGNGSNVATGVAMSGDATISNTGALTISAGAISGGVAGEIADGTITGADLANNIAIATTGSIGTTGNFAATGTTVNIKGSTWPAANGTGALTNNGAGVLSWSPALTTTLAPANILVGNGSSVATAVAMSGDATLSNAGALTISADAVTGAEVADASINNVDLKLVSSTVPEGGYILEASTSTGNADNNGLLVTVDGATSTNTGSVFMGTGGGRATGIRASGTEGDVSIGVEANASGSSATGEFGGVVTSASGAGRNYAIFAQAFGGTVNWAGYFAGNTAITGELAVGGGEDAGLAGYVLTSQGDDMPPTWTAPVSSIAPANFLIRGNSAGSNQEASSVYDNSTFTGIGRSAALTGSERFGFTADYGPSTYGGMYINANATGRPFYGYALGGSNVAWTYVDGADANKWKLVLSGGDRLTVTTAGNVGIGTTAPLSTLDVTGSMAIGTNYSGTFAAPADGAIIEGNVGIGTNAPSTKLEVSNGTTGSNNGNGNIEVNHANAPGNALLAKFSTGGDGTGTIYSQARMAGYDPNPHNTGGSNYGVWGHQNGGIGGFGVLATNGGTLTVPNRYVGLAGESSAIRIVDGTQGAGKVLKSDAAGNGSWQPMVATAFSAYNSADQSLVSGWNQISFNTEEYDIAGNYGSNAFVVPAGGQGLYHFTASVNFNSTEAQRYQIAFYKDGFTFKSVDYNFQLGEWTSCHIAADMMLDEGDVITVEVFLGGTADMTNGAANYTYFQGRKVN